MQNDRSRQPIAPGAGGSGGREGRRRAPRGLTRRSLNGPQTVEAYLRAQSLPRYMQRLREIEIEFSAQRRRLESAYLALSDHCGADANAFSRRWLAMALDWSFEHLNTLVREHNEWYPVEANLAMDPRTRDYVPIRGASYRRIELGPAWVLEHFPPGGRGAMTPKPPRRAPREPL